jgi:ParB family transcriptional regulator, chromosome partitioning protein
MSYDQIFDIKLSDIAISKQNVRHGNATQNLDELAASIKKHGLLQPVVLIGEFGTPPYQLIAGQRRFLAHQMLKKHTISAVFTGNIGKEKAILLSLVENLQSVDLNHADSAKAITSLYELYGKDDRKVQRETGLSLRRIRDYLSIDSQASPNMKLRLQQRQVSPADVKRALRAAQGDIKKAEQLLELMCQYPLTRYQKKRVTEYGERHAKASAQKIIEEATLPRVEQSIMVSLSDTVRQGLEKATKELSREAEEIVTEVLQHWLSDQGFIDEQQ